jgi:arabinan endo-1,5-alpha-L-arabinosidase
MKIRAFAIAILVCVAGPVSAAAAAAKPSVRAAQVAPSYRNPLSLELPTGQHGSSCADPFVLRVPSPHSTQWYLYCTSDPLNDSDQDDQGNLIIHNVPTYRSTDLVNWRYLADAFPVKPSWVTGGMWAPDVVHRGGRYLMYFTASDTTLAGGGPAIGVATSSTPSGPWTVSDTPVVPPTEAPDHAGKRWEFDPEVIYYRGTGYLYFGSYYGGNFVRTLSADGMTSVAKSERRIGIGNRYEGTFIVRRGGWFYFLGSATNCCNGPLTGYSVFAARSRSPLGPFLDRDGVSILASRVGGTPVLTQNGNRWVGAGHNAVITDYSGQQWIIYHAVSRLDPYFAGHVGFTKRPVLIDPLDWRAGWPTTGGGRGPSSSRQPGPAAQPGERTAYRPRYASTPQPGAELVRFSDDFTGTALAPQWSWVRPPDPSTYSVIAGHLRWQVQDADLHPEAGGPRASVLTEPAPAGDYIAETRIKTTVPLDGCCHNFAQAGMLNYQDDGNYMKLSVSSIWETRQTEFGKEVTPVPAGYPHYGNGVVGPLREWTYLRIVRQERGAIDYFTAYTSGTGYRWDRGPTWTRPLTGNGTIALVSMGGPGGYDSLFDYVHVYRLQSHTPVPVG